MEDTKIFDRKKRPPKEFVVTKYRKPRQVTRQVTRQVKSDVNKSKSRANANVKVNSDKIQLSVEKIE